MNTPIADTAIYQQTAQLDEKYKAQRDALIRAVKLLTGDRPSAMILRDKQTIARGIVAQVEQSL